MRLTKFTDYSLRVLIYLAVNEDKHVAVGDIAFAYNISKNHLMKVILFLSAADYVVTTRGKGGGIKLKVSPQQINIGDLVNKSEADTLLLECFSPALSECRIEQACLLQDAFRKASMAFYAVLDNYTLADLVTNKTTLERILNVA
jgi:Rrf2 family nitric oxide-sensitive transcriptional repressor